MTYTAILVILGLLAGSLYAVWRSNEEDKAARARDRRRMLDAAHRIPRPFSESAAQGFGRGNDAA